MLVPWAAPFLPDPRNRGPDRFQAVVQAQPRRVQGRPPVIRERRAHRLTVAEGRGRFGITLPGRLLQAVLDGTHAADPLLQFLLGVAVRLVDRKRRFAQVVELAELVRHARATPAPRRLGCER